MKFKTIANLRKFATLNPDFALNIQIHSVGAWRGDGTQACLFIEPIDPNARPWLYDEDVNCHNARALIRAIDRLLAGPHYTWEGKEVEYNENTTVYVEEDHGSYSGRVSLWDHHGLYRLEKALESFYHCDKLNITTTKEENV